MSEVPLQGHAANMAHSIGRVSFHIPQTRTGYFSYIIAVLHISHVVLRYWYFSYMIAVFALAFEAASVGRRPKEVEAT